MNQCSLAFSILPREFSSHRDTVSLFLITMFSFAHTKKKKKILAGLIDEMRKDVSILTLLAEVLCLLDMLVNSFAHTISTKPVDRYTRPEFTGRY